MTLRFARRLADEHFLSTILATIPLLTLFRVYVLHLRCGTSLLLAAILVPTDPVLAHGAHCALESALMAAFDSGRNRIRSVCAEAIDQNGGME